MARRTHWFTTALGEELVGWRREELLAEYPTIDERLLLVEFLRDEYGVPRRPACAFADVSPDEARQRDADLEQVLRDQAVRGPDEEWRRWDPALPSPETIAYVRRRGRWTEPRKRYTVHFRRWEGRWHAGFERIEGPEASAGALSTARERLRDELGRVRWMVSWRAVEEKFHLAPKAREAVRTFEEAWRSFEEAGERLRKTRGVLREGLLDTMEIGSRDAAEILGFDASTLLRFLRGDSPLGASTKKTSRPRRKKG